VKTETRGRDPDRGGFDPALKRRRRPGKVWRMRQVDGTARRRRRSDRRRWSRRVSWKAAIGPPRAPKTRVADPPALLAPEGPQAACAKRGENHESDERHGCSSSRSRGG